MEESEVAVFVCLFASLRFVEILENSVFEINFWCGREVLGYFMLVGRECL